MRIVLRNITDAPPLVGARLLHSGDFPAFFFANPKEIVFLRNTRRRRQSQNRAEGFQRRINKLVPRCVNNNQSINESIVIGTWLMLHGQERAWGPLLAMRHEP